MKRISLFVGFTLMLCLVSLATHTAAHKRENPSVVPKEAAQSAVPWIQIASDTEGVQERLERRFVVGVFRGSDGQPLAGARVELLADMRTMPGIHKVPPVLFSARGEPGTYGGSVRLPMAGPWLFRVKVSGPGRLITLDDLRDMLVQPYGFPYAGLLLFKLGAFLLLLGTGVWALWRWRDLPALTWVRLNVALGLLILMIGGALSYLHISIHSRPGF